MENEKNIANTKRLYYELMDYATDIATEQDLGKIEGYEFEKFQDFRSMKAYVINLFSQLLKPKAPSYSFIISKCIKFIEDNYSNNISLSDLANYTNKSKSYLSTLFKLETSVNFSIFLINYRIEKAKQLLIESDCMVYEIAEQVGFNNPYYFSKVFKDTTGMSCKMYRDKNYHGGVNQ
jgi:two-component system response regulator YesN